MRRSLLRSTARLLLVVLAPLALDGCVSIGVSRAALDVPSDARNASAPRAGALAVAIFEKAGERDAGRVASFPILSELARVTGTGEETVGRSMAPAWGLPDLSPGKYRLRVTRRLTPEGDIEPLENPGDKTFEVKAGEKTTLSVVLKKVPVFWSVLAAVTIVALVVLAIAGAGHLPPPPPARAARPPRPPRDRPPPPPAPPPAAAAPPARLRRDPARRSRRVRRPRSRCCRRVSRERVRRVRTAPHRHVSPFRAARAGRRGRERGSRARVEVGRDRRSDLVSRARWPPEVLPVTRLRAGRDGDRHPGPREASRRGRQFGQRQGLDEFPRARRQGIAKRRRLSPGLTMTGRSVQITQWSFS